MLSFKFNDKTFYLKEKNNNRTTKTHTSTSNTDLGRPKDLYTKRWQDQENKRHRLNLKPEEIDRI